ncbi:MAG: type II secretion system protein [Armatimonadota bacterium]
MKPASQPFRSNYKKNGFTLIEVLIVVTIISVMMSAIVAVFATIMQEWEREDSRIEAMQTVSSATQRIERDISNAVFADTISRFSPNDTLLVIMPYVQAYNMYVPTWDFNKLFYSSGVHVIYYLSDETGSYSRKGDILWRSVKKLYAGESNFNIDADWSMYYDLNKGRVSNLKAINFDVEDLGSSLTVEINAVSSYSIKDEEVQVSQKRTVCLRGALGR